MLQKNKSGKFFFNTESTAQALIKVDVTLKIVMMNEVFPLYKARWSYKVEFNVKIVVMNEMCDINEKGGCTKGRL